jgi:hypothetical protein
MPWNDALGAAGQLRAEAVDPGRDYLRADQLLHDVQQLGAAEELEQRLPRLGDTSRTSARGTKDIGNFY